MLAGVLGACSATTYGTGVGAGAQTMKDLTGIVSFGSKDSEPIDYEPRPGIVAPPPNAALPKPGQAATPANWPKDPTATATAAGNEKVYASNRSGTKEDVLMDPGFKLPKADRIVYDDHSKDPNSAETLMREMKEQRGDAEKLFAKKNAAAGGSVDENGNPVRTTLTEPPAEYRVPDPEAPEEFIAAKNEKWWQVFKRKPSAAATPVDGPEGVPDPSATQPD
ncbi:MAG: hypothetical protein KDJ88_07150 [Bauldia sp.]|nr:hypothetical protein [Bauldia sp.]